MFREFITKTLTTRICFSQSPKPTNRQQTSRFIALRPKKENHSPKRNSIKLKTLVLGIIMSLLDENMNQNKHNYSNKNVSKKTKTHKSNHPFPSTSPNIEPQASKLHQNKIKCSIFFYFIIIIFLSSFIIESTIFWD